MVDNHIELTDSIFALRVSKTPLPHAARYLLDSCCLAIRHSIGGNAYLQYLDDTVGSQDFLGISDNDEMRFSKEDGWLQGVGFQIYIPHNIRILSATVWRQMQNNYGTLKLVTKTEFGLPVANHYYASPDGQYLSAMYHPTIIPNTQMECLYIHEAFGLLLVDAHVVGWCFRKPTRYLHTEADNMVYLAQLDSIHLQIYRLMNRKGYDLMDDQDPEIRMKLQTIATELTTEYVDHPAAQAMAKDIYDTLKVFYDQ